MLEASYGLGFTLGPLIGQVLYSHYGFAKCFLIISTILFIPLGLIFLMQFSKEEQDNLSRDKSHIEELTYKKLLSNRRTLTTLFVLFGCIVCMIFYEPLLSNQLTAMNVEINKIGKPLIS